MKKLTKVILESGLVPKHTAKMMEKWGALEEGASDLVGKHKVTTETLEEFASDIADLMTTRPIKETVLDDIQILGEQVIIKSPGKGAFQAVRDEMGNFFISAHAPIVRGDIVRVHELGRSAEEAADYLNVTAVTPIYTGEVVRAKILILSP